MTKKKGDLLLVLVVANCCTVTEEFTGTLSHAKRAATSEYKDHLRDAEMRVVDGDGYVLSCKKVKDRKWSNTMHARQWL